MVCTYFLSVPDGSPLWVGRSWFLSVCDVRSAVRGSATIGRSRSWAATQAGRGGLHLLSVCSGWFASVGGPVLVFERVRCAVGGSWVGDYRALAELGGYPGGSRWSALTFCLFRMVHLSRRGPPRFWSDVAKERSD
ncbi:hypothetical protein GCM10011588_24610 [Nocardia jinanensis]|uniref:Uncharacterized protein n=1 Tax=Nocardia jinanensis TaxID=382504 RepID=A0A917VS73_9NOCA|nr:hypothetical protein GCM10011588_24610 [Nocardia jinanensis]